jgi:AcrR family transcriptional regulator
MQQKSGKSVKSRVPATEAKRLLIAAAIRLMSTTPFSKITVRDVADEAGLNASTILRNFNSQEELFVAVTQELGWQLLDRSKSLGNKIVIGDPTFRLLAQLKAWLIGNGVSPSVFIEQYEDGLAENVSQRVSELFSLNDRQTAAYTVIGQLLAESYSVFLETHPWSQEAINDAFALIFEFQKRIPEITKDLGWEEEIHSI